MKYYTVVLLEVKGDEDSHLATFHWVKDTDPDADPFYFSATERLVKEYGNEKVLFYHSTADLLSHLSMRIKCECAVLREESKMWDCFIESAEKVANEETVKKTKDLCIEAQDTHMLLIGHLVRRFNRKQLEKGRFEREITDELALQSYDLLMKYHRMTA